MSDAYQPLKNVQFVPRDQLKPNDYNPNIVDKEELDLLEQSMIVNGWTMPIVVDGDYTIIDGYHRWTISKRPKIDKMMNGMIPVVIVDHKDSDKKKYGTVTHNRARGTHLLKPMQKMVRELLDSGKSIDEVKTNLGMTDEEIYRLSAESKDDFLKLMNEPAGAK